MRNESAQFERHSEPAMSGCPDTRVQPQGKLVIILRNEDPHISNQKQEHTMFHKCWPRPQQPCVCVFTYRQCAVPSPRSHTGCLPRGPVCRCHAPLPHHPHSASTAPEREMDREKMTSQSKRSRSVCTFGISLEGQRKQIPK